VEELVPWALGLLLGAAYPRRLGGVGRRALFIVLVVVLGASVTVLSGEWSENPGYALVDIGQTWLAATIALYARRHLPWRLQRKPGAAES
jgi:hypothetical protein